MRLTDFIYGEFDVEPVIEELIHSKPIQRLKHIHQGGFVHWVNPELNQTRYDHSIGVYYLVTRLGAGIEEQIAALLHDVSHTAFSHVVDYVLDCKDEDYHERIFDSIIRQSEIPAILQKHGFDIAILQDERHTLLERPLPDLCADRLDYTLRDLYRDKRLSLDQIESFLNELTVVNHQIFIKSKAAADWIKEQYTILIRDYFRKKEYVFANFELARILRQAYQENIIKEDDFLKTDDEVIARLFTYDRFAKEIENIKHLSGIENFDLSTAPYKKRVLEPKYLM